MKLPDDLSEFVTKCCLTGVIVNTFKNYGLQ